VLVFFAIFTLSTLWQISSLFKSQDNIQPVSHTTETNSHIMNIPKILYGTAWKKERTTKLVLDAVLSGFRGIDTACQPRHYREDLVGKALTELRTKHNINRKDLFIQTKFTSLGGQDPNTVPYDKNAPLTEQAKQSIQVSLKNLNVDYLDSILLHSPEDTMEKTIQVWRVFEEYYNKGILKQIGISNIYDLNELKQLYEKATVKPSYVQNRFYATSQYDKGIRAFCKEHGIQYQSFWTLTANPHAVNSEFVKKIARERSLTTEQVFYRYIMDLGIVPLCGTTNSEHMSEDLLVPEIDSLTQEEIDSITKILDTKK
jgi:diketogulonate reductase-like aldo/keto reductase